MRPVTIVRPVTIDRDGWHTVWRRTNKAVLCAVWRGTTLVADLSYPKLRRSLESIAADFVSEAISIGQVRLDKAQATEVVR